MDINADSPWKQATLWVNGNKVEWNTELILIRGQDNDVSVEVPPTIAAQLNLGLTEDGGLNIVAFPAFGDWVDPIDGKFHWKLAPSDGESGHIALVFYSREVDMHWDHRCRVLSSNLSDEAEALINGAPVPSEGMDFKPGDVWGLSLRIKPDSPLRSLPIKLNCSIVAGSDLELTSDPAFGIATTEYEWSVTGVKGEGAFRLSLHSEVMTGALDLPICRLTSLGPVSDYVTVQIDGMPLTSGQEALFSSWGLHTITLLPKPGVTVPDKVKLNADRPEFLLLAPDGDVAQSLDPVKGATWECRCTVTGSGVVMKRLIKASFDQLPSMPLDIPVDLARGKYQMHFFDVKGPHPAPPPSTQGPLVVQPGQIIELNVRVDDHPVENPVEGVSVMFIAPDYPDELAVSNAYGRASTVKGISYSQSGRLVEIVAKTTEATGRLSMARLQIKVS